MTLVSSEIPFKTLIDRSADPLALTGPDGLHRYVSASVKDVLGYTAEERIGRPGSELIHPEDHARLLPDFIRLQASPGATNTLTMRIRHKDGTYRWMECVVTNLLQEPGVNGILCTYRDVSARESAQAALLRSEESFRSLIERSPMGIVVHRDRKTIYTNQALLSMLGHPDAGPLLGKSPLIMISRDDQELVEHRMSELYLGRPVPPRPIHMLRADGSAITCEVEGARFTFDGKPAAVVFVRDVSERMEMLARLSLADRLASMGTLAAGVAHEINNPLAYVIANLGMLAAELPRMLAVMSPGGKIGALEAEQLLRDAREGASQIQAVVRDLMSLSRSGDEHAGPVDVREVLRSSLRMSRNEIRHRARLIEDYAEVQPVAASESRLGQVFLNLLINAAQSIPDGHAAANEIRVIARPGPGDTVVVEVRDTGVGIPPELIPRIFDPFFTTKPGGTGTGLGLAIGHGIVRALGGRLDVESQVGRGSCFRVTLPAAPGLAPEDKSPAPQAASTGGRVLVIDDEPNIGVSLRLLLAPVHQVVAVTRAREGLDRLARGERFDAVLCDLMMPEMNGMELHAELSRSNPALLPRLAFLTGGAFTDAAREFLASQDRPCLQKPFDERSLHAVLKTLIGR